MARFFYTPKPRQFDYKPRYYDPEQEAREQRRRELLGERLTNTDAEEYVPGELLRHRKMQRMIAADSNAARRKKSSSMIVLVAVLVLLGLAVAWVLN